MSKTPEEKEDEMAEAAIRAANAEAEAEENEAEKSATEAAATAVAAANAGAALANAEGAKAQQRAAEVAEQVQEENSWLKDQVSSLHRNSEAQATMLAKTQQELNSLKPLLSSIAEHLTPPKSMQSEPNKDREASPETEALKKEEEDRREEKRRQKAEAKKPGRRWI